jgi:hypothetical protein
MKLRIPAILFLALIQACQHATPVTKAGLIEQSRHYKEPKVATWYYIGSKDGRDFFRFNDVDGSRTYSVTSGEIPLKKPAFPKTMNSKQWMVMPWGPQAPRNRWILPGRE